jgi:hypothetical protein
MGFVLIYDRLEGDVLSVFLVPLFKLMYSEEPKIHILHYFHVVSHGAPNFLEDQGNFSRQFHPFRGT